MPEVQIRCPEGPRRLLAKARLVGDRPHVTDGNLIEFYCNDCTRSRRRKDPAVSRVLHRFDLTGTLVESVVERGRRAEGSGADSRR